MRADAKKNYEHILAVASVVVTEHGVDASLRDIARRAGVGLGTLYRHFPTREALLEALLRASFDEFTTKARELETVSSPDDALVATRRRCIHGQLSRCCGHDDGSQGGPGVRTPHFMHHDAHGRHATSRSCSGRRSGAYRHRW